MKRGILITIALACAAAQAAAQLRITGLDGLASRAKESVEITLDANLMQLAAGFIDGKNADDAKVKALLAGLKAITVRSFEFGEAGQYRQEDIEPIRAQLRGPGWSRIVNVNDSGETAEIYARMEGGRAAGFAIIATEPTELTVVAIEGNIDLNDLASLGGQLGIPPIPVPKESLVPKEKNKGKGKASK